MNEHDESTAPVAERDVRRALAPRNRDAEAFEDATLERIAELEAAAEGEGDDSPELRLVEGSTNGTDLRFVRRAAAFLPWTLVAKGLFPAAKVAGPKAGWKGLGALLSLPALSVILLLGTFVTAFSAMPKTDTGEPMTRRAMWREFDKWWARHWWKVALGLGVILPLVICGYVDVLFGVVLIAMLVLVAILRFMHHIGKGTRDQIGPLAFNFLFQMSLWMFMQPAFRGNDAWVGRSRAAAGAVILVVGALICFTLWQRTLPWTVRKRIAVVFLPVMLLTCLVGAHGARRPSLERCVAFAERPDEFGGVRGDPWRCWVPLVQSLRYLEEHGALSAGTMRSSGIAASFDEHWGDQRLDEEPVVAAVRAGVFTDEDAAAVVALGEVDWMFPSVNSIGDIYLAHHQIASLMRLGILGEDQHAALVSAVLEEWPETDTVCWDLRQILRCVELLEILGRIDLVHARRDEIAAVLLGHWIGDEYPQLPGATFVPYPEHGIGSRADFFYHQSSHDALQLMLRVGVPEGVDAERFAFWLRESADPGFYVPGLITPDPWIYAMSADYELLRAWLRSEGRPVPGRSSVHAALLDPATLGTLLFTVLCVYAVLRAPTAPRRDEERKFRFPRR